MDENNLSVSIESVLFALLIVLTLDSILRVLVLIGFVTVNTGLNAFDVVSIEILPSFVTASAYWLAGVGGLWFVAHRLGYMRPYVLALMGVAVSLGMTLLYSGMNINPLWLAVNTGRAALMGWVLWRLAYRKPR